MLGFIAMIGLLLCPSRPTHNKTARNTEPRGNALLNFELGTNVGPEGLITILQVNQRRRKFATHV